MSAGVFLVIWGNSMGFARGSPSIEDAPSKQNNLEVNFSNLLAEAIAFPQSYLTEICLGKY
ncbi:hypothetical protein AKJ16_DCAP27542 [Drosera capensis]